MWDAWVAYDRRRSLSATYVSGTRERAPKRTPYLQHELRRLPVAGLGHGGSETRTSGHRSKRGLNAPDDARCRREIDGRQSSHQKADVEPAVASRIAPPTGPGMKVGAGWPRSL